MRSPNRLLFPFALLLVPILLACAAPDPRADSRADPGDSRPAPERGELPDFLLGGIQVHEADHADWFANLEARGMNTVEVTEYAKQGDWDTDHMWWEEESPWVVEEIRGAKRAGLEVVLILRVALDHAFERNAFLWHGMILPKTDEQLASWFEQYGRFCAKWAEIAEREGVDVLVIGSEMNALASTVPIDDVPPLEEYFLSEEKQVERREEVLARRELVEDKELSLRDKERFATVEEYLDARITTEKAWAETTAGEGVEAINARRATLDRHWRELITQVREIYGGPLSYAANFDQYHEVGFWDALDFMGINAYFELRTEWVEPDERERLEALLVEGWRDVLGKIQAIREERGVTDQPVIFTELGYTFRRNSTLRPWADTGFSMIYTPRENPDGTPAEPEKRVIVWREEPVDREERALAIRALRRAHEEFEDPFLRGILYWKLSSHDYHVKDESFLVVIGEGSDDPALAELRAFL